MIEVDLTNREKIPFTSQQLDNIIIAIHEKADLSELTLDNSITATHIFFKEDTHSFEEGFKIKVRFQKEDEETTTTIVEELVIYETNDEWLDAYQELKNI